MPIKNLQLALRTIHVKSLVCFKLYKTFPNVLEAALCLKIKSFIRVARHDLEAV